MVLASALNLPSTVTQSTTLWSESPEKSSRSHFNFTVISSPGRTRLPSAGSVTFSRSPVGCPCKISWQTSETPPGWLSPAAATVAGTDTPPRSTNTESHPSACARRCLVPSTTTPFGRDPQQPPPAAKADQMVPNYYEGIQFIPSR